MPVVAEVEKRYNKPPQNKTEGPATAAADYFSRICGLAAVLPLELPGPLMLTHGLESVWGLARLEGPRWFHQQVW